ncbi:MAG: hypothetical protein JW878_07410 [Methanomicrobia archaeon]|nr:hypothetical protein [Methanomicrobia archaeon]
MERIQQKIYLSRKSLNSLEFEHEVLRIPLKAGEETSFELLVINRGEPTHVHFSLSKGIRDKLMLMQDKAYIIDEEKVAAIVRLPKSYAGAVDKFGIGEISVSTGYGATKRSFSVEIVESRESETIGEEAGTEREVVVDTAVKEKKERALSTDERELLSRLAVSACAAILFFVSLEIMHIFSESHAYMSMFVSAVIASLIFIFVVIYNY